MLILEFCSASISSNALNRSYGLIPSYLSSPRSREGLNNFCSNSSTAPSLKVLETWPRGISSPSSRSHPAQKFATQAHILVRFGAKTEKSDQGDHGYLPLRFLCESQAPTHKVKIFHNACRNTKSATRIDTDNVPVDFFCGTWHRYFVDITLALMPKGLIWSSALHNDHSRDLTAH
jgi:hypothetical protein